MSAYGTSAHASRQPHTSQANGFAKPVRSATWDSQNQLYENDRPHLAPEHMNGLHKKPSGDMSTIGTDQDSVLEYYKSHTNNKKGPSAVKGKPKKRPARGNSGDPKWPDTAHDENNWIHRDKLKEIETRELEEAGFVVERGSRSNSRSQSATRRTRDRRASEAAEQAQNGDERSDARRVVSPIPAGDEDAADEDYQTGSPRAYDDNASETQPASPRTGNHTLRPSTSRIPLAKSSGLPVPSSVSDRDGPQTRSRAGSENWNGDADGARARARSASAGSQVLMDGVDAHRQTTPPFSHKRKGSSGSASPPKTPQKSPMKAKTPGKPAAASGARKTSTKTPAKARLASGTSPPKRPGTSSGSASRPSTSHRPEGEAPWLATMYKPDPRLPPDQQIIPTHAKRMQQEQWENEGKTASMYGKDFRMLNTEEFQDKRHSQIQAIDLEKTQSNEAWPLPSPTKEPSLDNRNTKSPTNEQGGYKLTPTIPQSPRGVSPKLGPATAPADEPHPKPMRLPEPAEEVKEKKGCCCIVM